MKKFILAVALILSFISSEAAAVTVWDAPSAAPATGTMRFPVCTSSSCSPVRLQISDVLTYVLATGGNFTGNAATATLLQTPRTIGGVTFSGGANIVPQMIQTVDDAADATTFVLFGNASGSVTTGQQPKTNTSLTFNASTGSLAATTFSGPLSGNASTATALQTTRAIYGNNFDGTAALTQVIASTFGGTGNGFAKFSGPTTSEKTFTLPDASAAILTDNSTVTVTQGGTGRATGTTAYSLVATGTTATGAQQTLANGATTEILVGGGASALPVWTTATGTGAPVRAGSPTFTGTPVLSTSTATSINGLTISTTTGTLTLANSSSLITSGGNALTLTTSGTTNITFPSGTDTATTLTATQTMTNKRMTPRIQSVTSSATVTPSADNDDEVVITAQAAGLTLANPSGTPVQGQAIVIRIKDNGTSRSISYDTQYRAIGVTLPSATVINKTLYLAMIWNADAIKWDVVGSAQEI